MFKKFFFTYICVNNIVFCFFKNCCIRFHFKVTLFGSYVDELNAFIACGETENVVVVVLLTKIKIFQGIFILWSCHHFFVTDFINIWQVVFSQFMYPGQATIQNTIYARNVLFNLTFDAALLLKKR